MHYRTLPGTALNVSEVCLGTMTWGKQNTEAMRTHSSTTRSRRAWPTSWPMPIAVAEGTRSRGRAVSILES
jgi:hypothetical protein